MEQDGTFNMHEIISDEEQRYYETLKETTGLRFDAVHLKHVNQVKFKQHNQKSNERIIRSRRG